MRRFVVTAEQDLDKLNALLHDERFDGDAIQFDPAAAVLEVPFERLFHDGPERVIEKIWGSYCIAERDILKCTLRISHVVSHEFEDLQRIGAYPVFEIRYDSQEGTLEFDCIIPTRFVVHVSALHVEYEETEYRGRARVEKIAGGESWSRVSGDG
jgi:hypothetical protein